jgi:hypothetical protein
MIMSSGSFNITVHDEDGRNCFADAVITTYADSPTGMIELSFVEPNNNNKSAIVYIMTKEEAHQFLDAIKMAVKKL